MYGKFNRNNKKEKKIMGGKPSKGTPKDKRLKINNIKTPKNCPFKKRK